MKKIVALALCLIMALSLATVAFGASTYDNFYKWENEKWAKQDLKSVAISYTEPSETKQDGELISGTVGYYTIGNTKYFEVDSTDASARLDVNGKTVYLAEAANGGNDVAYKMVGTMVKSSTKCGEAQFDKTDFVNPNYNPDGKIVKVVDSDGVVTYYRVAGGPARILVDGKVRACTLLNEDEDWESKNGVNNIGNGEYVINAHKWDVVITSDSAAETVTGTAVCSKCGQKAVVTSDKSTIPSGATVVAEPDYYIYFTAAAAGTTTTTTSGVTSAKTFDAGVALYAGMALMSVAGSAVVIGKKKEF